MGKFDIQRAFINIDSSYFSVEIVLFQRPQAGKILYDILNIHKIGEGVEELKSISKLNKLWANKARMKTANKSNSELINKIPDNDSINGHIFRDAEGHIENTPENRAILEEVANSKENLRGIDKYGNEWYTKILPDGREAWVESRNGSIFDGGINSKSKSWNPNTGLKQHEWGDI